MYKKIFFLIGFLSSLTSYTQIGEEWLGELIRNDSTQIVFNFRVENIGSKKVIYIINAKEKIIVEDVRFTADSVFITMPVFESTISAAITNDYWTGIWTKGGSTTEQNMLFKASNGKERFAFKLSKAANNITGKWSVHFANDTSADFPSVGEFVQKGNKLTGTFLNPTGDFRYLEGVVDGDQLRLSTFDGSHAFLFTATIKDSKTITDGYFYSGATYKEAWSALKNNKAKVNTAAVAMRLQPGEERLNFKFPDLNGKEVSINDEQFKDKVVIVQIMGSWCPNCMDETAFLSKYYKKNKERGVEVISLAYEYSTDFERSAKSLKKFQQLFKVEYPMLITGVKISDSLRTEKTLPEITPIRFFPTSIIIDRKGKVRKFDTEFVGPGTGTYHEKYVATFNSFIEKLLNEK